MVAKISIFLPLVLVTPAVVPRNDNVGESIRCLFLVLIVLQDWQVLFFGQGQSVSFFRIDSPYVGTTGEQPKKGGSMADKIPFHRPGNGRAKKRGLDLRPSSSARGYGANWQKLRLMVLAAEPLCRHCSRPGLDVDHILPLASGGTNDRNNLQVLCHSCHSAKTAADQLRK
jgi:hypothetical protein